MQKTGPIGTTRNGPISRKSQTSKKKKIHILKQWFGPWQALFTPQNFLSEASKRYEMRKTGPVRVQSLSVIFRFAHKKRNKYRHTFASHVCTGQDRKKRFHQNIGTLHPHILHHSEIEIFFVRARIIWETEKRVWTERNGTGPFGSWFILWVSV